MTDAYRLLRKELVGLRLAAGLSQAKLAEGARQTGVLMCEIRAR